jgi:hypothetical protein
MKVQTIEDEIFATSMELAEKSTRIEYLAGAVDSSMREKLLDCSLTLKSLSRKLNMSLLLENKPNLLSLVYGSIAEAIRTEVSEGSKAVLRNLHLHIAQKVKDLLGSVEVVEPSKSSTPSEISEEWKELLGNDRIEKMAIEMSRLAAKGRSNSDIIIDVLGMLPRIVKTVL